MGLFTGNTAITSFDEIKYFPNAKIKAKAFDTCSSLKNANFQGVTIYEHAANVGRFFASCTALENVDISGAYIDYTCYMMFSYTANLKSLTCSGEEFRDVQILSLMFQRSGIETVNISSWNLSNVKQMNNMFSDQGMSNVWTYTNKIICEDMTLPKCTTMSKLAAKNKVSYVSLKNMYAPVLVNCSGLFMYDDNLQTVDMSGISIPSACSTESMFSGCTSLKEINLEGASIKTSTCLKMFYNCKVLESIDLSGLHTEECTDMSSMFYGCNSIESFVVSSSFFGAFSRTDAPLTSLDISPLKNWSDRQQINDMFDALPNLNGGAATLSIYRIAYDIADGDGLIAAATAKGWIINRI